MFVHMYNLYLLCGGGIDIYIHLWWSYASIYSIPVSVNTLGQFSIFVIPCILKCFYSSSAFCYSRHPFFAVYMEVYGCQMNVNDADIAWSILKDAGYQKTQYVEDVRIYLMIDDGRFACINSLML